MKRKKAQLGTELNKLSEAVAKIFGDKEVMSCKEENRNFEKQQKEVAL